MPLAFVKDADLDGMASYTVQVDPHDGKDHVALIRFDKWTGQWALLHTNGLIERFETLLAARAGARDFYG